MLSPFFHETFAPERRYLAALLEYAALGRTGTLREIASDTGIPMGESSGKVAPTLGYAQGMGLIAVEGDKGIRPILTDFGRCVFQEDPYLGEELTQWLVHFNLCRGDIGAPTWHYTFALGRLGKAFSKTQLEEHLISVLGLKQRIIGPMMVTYTDDAALGRAGVLRVEGDMIVRVKAPILQSFARGYSAHVLTLLETCFLSESQVTVTDFNEKTHWFDICLWTERELEAALTMMGETGNISIDRQMRPWIIERKSTAREAWLTVWEDLA